MPLLNGLLEKSAGFIEQRFAALHDALDVRSYAGRELGELHVFPHAQTHHATHVRCAGFKNVRVELRKTRPQL